jgi:hypothetical protein
VPIIPTPIMMRSRVVDLIKKMIEIEIINHIVPMAWIFILFVIPLFFWNSRI